MFRWTVASAVVVVAVAAMPVVSEAQVFPAPGGLAKCLADSTTGKDRKDLARWVFLSMAAHPEIKQYSSPDTPAATEESSRVMAALVTRLLTEACATETKAAMRTGGVALQRAFQSLGQLAMQELMTDRAVLETMSLFERHLDQKRSVDLAGGK